MSHEFAVYRHVSELMKLMGLPSSSDPVVYVNALENKNNNSSADAQVSLYDAKKKILESTNKSQAFLQKYNELKSKNIKELDSFVCLISRLLDDSQVINVLEKTSTGTVERSSARASSVIPIASNLTPEDVGKIQDEISKATSRQISSAATSSKKTVFKDKSPPKKLNFPTFPDWIRQRPYMSLDFLPDRTTVPFLEDLRNISVVMQEKMLIEDLLYCCEGIEGKFIKCEPLARSNEVRKFRVDPRLDPSLTKMVERILPICSMYSGIIRFIERKYDFKHGLVNQALVSAISSIMKEYSLLIARLEHQQRSGHLTLQKFWFYVQNTTRTMEILSSVISSIHDNCRGGSVLSVLHEKTLSNVGDDKSKKLCFHLTRAASVPYFEILENWIYKGIITDPYFEFMVMENDDIHKEKLGEDFNDAYWENKYTLKSENTPVFLQKVSTKILKTGKYLNVIRECGRDVCCPSAESLEYDSNENQSLEKIESAMQYASSLLLDVLVREMDLMTRLRSIKHYFFLDKGDFIVQFMDMAKHEMKRKMEDIHLPRLETLTELALRTSTANADPYKDDLKVDLLQVDLVTQLMKILSIETKQEKEFKIDNFDLSGLESFTFDYVVRWPVSLVLNRKSLAKYQILFRHLFYCKYVERQLCNVWVRDKSLKKLVPNASLDSRAYALRQRMLNFVQNFEYYFMLEVIEPHWQLFESNMSEVTNVDEVLKHHEELLSNCLKDSMLTNDSVLRTLHKLMMICVSFHNFMQKLSEGFRPPKSLKQYSSTAPVSAEHKRIVLETLSEHIDDVLHSESYEKIVSIMEKDFAREFVSLQEKIIKLSENSSDHKLGNIILRLDFNGFYKQQLEKNASDSNRTPFFKNLPSSSST